MRSVIFVETASGTKVHAYNAEAERVIDMEVPNAMAYLKAIGEANVKVIPSQPAPGVKVTTHLIEGAR